jgi:hypothetical protein
VTTRTWHCETCGQNLRAHWCHCGGCCLTFGGVTGFDRHFYSLTDGGCRPPEELAGMVNRRTGEPIYQTEVIDGVTVWHRPLIRTPFSPRAKPLSAVPPAGPVSGGQ